MILFLFLTFASLSQTVYAEGSKTELKASWLGVAGVALSDGETTILFDPVVTKPTLTHWITGAQFNSDPEKVKALLSKPLIGRTKGIFISHTHFDHAVDAPAIAKATGAKVFGGESVETLMKFNAAETAYGKVADNTVTPVGQFKVTPLRRTHAPILSLLQFLPGPIEKTFQANFYEYREGEVWGFWIEHPAANLLIDQGSHFFEPNKRYADRTDYYFVGVANKVSVDDLVMNNIAVIRPQLVIPLHHDYFFTNHEILDDAILPGMGLSVIQEALKEKVLKTKWLQPKRFEVITIIKQN